MSIGDVMMKLATAKLALPEGGNDA